MENLTHHIIILTVVSLCSFHAMASDDYLMLLESEAAETRIDYGNKHKISRVNNTNQNAVVKREWQGDCDYDIDALPSDLAKDEFSSYLKQCALGSSIFYRRLKMAAQDLIYKNYKNSKSANLSAIREDIQRYF